MEEIITLIQNVGIVGAIAIFLIYYLVRTQSQQLNEIKNAIEEQTRVNKSLIGLLNGLKALIENHLKHQQEKLNDIESELKNIRNDLITLKKGKF